jgi:ABC-type Fe3+ transport system substrate-binding protein
VVALPLGNESLIVHNTAGVVRGGPHPAEAQKFFEYLQRSAVEEKLVQAKALESAMPGDTNNAPGLRVDWDAMLRDLDPATKELEAIFLR